MTSQQTLPNSIGQRELASGGGWSKVSLGTADAFPVVASVSLQKIAIFRREREKRRQEIRLLIAG